MDLSSNIFFYLKWDEIIVSTTAEDECSIQQMFNVFYMPGIRDKNTEYIKYMVPVLKMLRI